MIKRKLEPSHPGELLKTLYLEPLGLTQGETAKYLGVTRKTLSMLLNGRQGVSAEMAIRLSKALKTSVEVWMNAQNSYDLWHAEQKVDLSKVKVLRNIAPIRTRSEVAKPVRTRG